MIWPVAFIEGFSTLAVEVIAIRLAIPVAGSSMVLTGVMLGVVLFALSAGYWRGGAISAKWDPKRTRQILARNLVIAAALYAVAFPVEARLLDRLLDSLNLPLAIGVTALALFALPVYLASQTVPMLAELTAGDGHAGKASGKVLFFSTIGSVAGGVVTPVWFFPVLGVTRTTYIVCLALAVAGVIMWRKIAIGLAALAIGPILNAWMRPAGDLFSFDSAYQSIRISNDTAADGRAERVLTIGGGRASGVYADSGESSFPYTIAAERALAESGASTVLAIGAAGFNLPRDAARRNGIEQIDAVDVDASVKPIAERYFLKEKLSPKIRFLPLSGRYAVRKLAHEGRRYRFAFLDAYFGKGIPDELVTVEFFRDVKVIADRVVLNAGLDHKLESAFARNLLATFHEALGGAWTLDAKPNDPEEITNILIMNWPAAGTAEWKGSGTIYRDDRNTADRDRVALVWGGGAP